ncbi:MAG: FAD-dependent oxidoreductase [Oscillospiraceae bacterium]|nr:FAD-dependent oxidoreductase [Oscillospiraceae bacterium]
MKHVIIGAGAAGITAAGVIRKLRQNDEIVVISEDKLVTSRCMLHKYISGEREAEKLSFVPDDFFVNNNIKRLAGTVVTGIDTAAKKVISADGETDYDKLLIATGSQSAIPPVGALRTAKNVFGLRHFTDAKAIREAAAGARKVAVIGGGLVGLDAVYALLDLKKDISVVDIAPRILAINLEEKAAAAYYERFVDAGCKFYLACGVSGTAEDDKGNVTEIKLADGRSLPCDMVIAAAGVRPATAFIEGSGIDCDRSIKTDEHLKTNCADVFAAGDVTGLSGIWPNAKRQGEVAARNMCGEKTEYKDRYAIKNTVNFFGLLTMSIGAPEPEENDTVLLREDHRIYQKVILRDGCVAGVTLQGDISNSGFWQYLIKNKIRVDAAGKPVWKLSFADFCSLDEKGEYLWTTAG